MMFGATKTAKIILEQRYLRKREDGSVSESIPQLLDRVVRAVAKAEKPADRKQFEQDFRDIIAEGKFCPNSPTLMNAGSERGQLAACFVLPVEDHIDQIFQTLHHTAIIQQSGGGTGFTFGHLRHHGDTVSSTGGPASGPVGFLKLFNQATEAIKQAGARRGANMGILPVWHPDIEEFIQCKSNEGAIRNFNISVAVTNEYMDAVEKRQPWNLLSPRTQTVVRTLDAESLMDLIAKHAWTNGEPGLVFLDRVNEDNPTPELGSIESTNPCGEQPLLPYEACNLGSINISAFVRREDADLDWASFERTIRMAVRFLDNVIDVNQYPLPQIEKMVQLNRKIGLGLMGFADALIQLNQAYDSTAATMTAKRIAQFFATKAREASEELGRERGHCPQWLNALHQHPRPRRNATVTTIAPTGTVSLLCGCSPGIEPVFSFLTLRNILDGKSVTDIHPLFERHCQQNQVSIQSVLTWLQSQKGDTSLHRFPGLPQPDLWKTATAIPWNVHLEIQGIFQDHVDNGVSKTINLPNAATVEDVKKVFLKAWKRRLKGITVYRHSSREVQSQDVPKDLHITCGSPLIASEGCLYCPTCGISLCGTD